MPKQKKMLKSWLPNLSVASEVASKLVDLAASLSLIVKKHALTAIPALPGQELHVLAVIPAQSFYWLGQSQRMLCPLCANIRVTASRWQLTVSRAATNREAGLAPCMASQSCRFPHTLEALLCIKCYEHAKALIQGVCEQRRNSRV